MICVHFLSVYAKTNDTEEFHKKEKTTMKKFLALLLAVLTLVPMFVACQDSGDKPSDSTAKPNDDVTETDDPYDDKLPEDLYYEDEMDGRDFVIAAPSHADWGPEWYNLEEDTGDTIDSAIYNRNRQLEERFGIVISSMALGGTNDMASQFTTYAVADKEQIDVLSVGYYQSGKPLITNDYVLAWNNVDGKGKAVEYLDLDRDWWNKSITDTLSICGRYYYLSGDVNWFTMPETSVCYFNKNVAAKNKVENLYDTVKNYEWTFERCFDIAKSIANESSGDGKWDESDTYGAIQNTIIGVTGFLYGANYETVTMGKKGPEMNFKGTKITNIIQWLVEFCDNDKHVSYTESFNDAPDSTGIPIFFDDRALFYFDILMHAEGFRDEASDFGIIPYPMYDEEQKVYVSYANQWGLVSALPCTSKNPDRTAAILHAMGALSRKSIVPAYYEKTLMGKIKRDDESEDMLNIIFANVLYDFGIAYCTNLAYIPCKELVEKTDPNITSWYGRQKNPIFNNYFELYSHVYKKVYGKAPEKPKNF